MSKTKGLPFEMRQAIKQNYKNQTTRKMYAKHASYFCAYIKQQGYTSNFVRNNPQQVLQAYANDLVSEGKSPDTVHTYLSFPCVFFSIPMDAIDKPVRSIGSYRKNTEGSRNAQGEREGKATANIRLTEFQSKVGIRRQELTRLRGNNLVQDESGERRCRQKYFFSIEPTIELIVPKRSSNSTRRCRVPIVSEETA